MKNYLRSIAPCAVLGKVVQFVYGRVEIDDIPISMSQIAKLQSGDKTNHLLFLKVGVATGVFGFGI